MITLRMSFSDMRPASPRSGGGPVPGPLGPTDPRRVAFPGGPPVGTRVSGAGSVVVRSTPPVPHWSRSTTWLSPAGARKASTAGSLSLQDGHGDALAPRGRRTVPPGARTGRGRVAQARRRGPRAPPPARTARAGAGSTSSPKAFSATRAAGRRGPRPRGRGPAGSGCARRTGSSWRPRRPPRPRRRWSSLRSGDVVAVGGPGRAGPGPRSTRRRRRTRCRTGRRPGRDRCRPRRRLRRRRASRRPVGGVRRRTRARRCR